MHSCYTTLLGQCIAFATPADAIAFALVCACGIIGATLLLIALALRAYNSPSARFRRRMRQRTHRALRPVTTYHPLTRCERAHFHHVMRRGL